MACEFDCLYKNVAQNVKVEIESLIDRDAERVRQGEEAARNGWGDNGAKAWEDRRKDEARGIDEMLEIDGLLCDEMVCGLAMESVRKRVEELSIDIKLTREQR